MRMYLKGEPIYSCGYARSECRLELSELATSLRISRSYSVAVAGEYYRALKLRATASNVTATQVLAIALRCQSSSLVVSTRKCISVWWSECAP